METIFINKVEFELVPVYSWREPASSGFETYVVNQPFGSQPPRGYMLRPMPVKHSLNQPKESLK